MSNNRGTKPENIHQPYMLNVVNKQAKKLANILNLAIESKQDTIIKARNSNRKYDYDPQHLKLPNKKGKYIVIEPRNNSFEDLYFDKIKSIEEVPCPGKYVYDLTVEDTRNFMYQSIALRDTFHSAGVGNKINITKGVPRLRELIQLTKNPKQTSMMVYVDPSIEREKKEVEKIMSYIQLTLIKDIVRRTYIYYDPKKEKLPYDILNVYDTMAKVFKTSGWCQDETNHFPFVLHLEIDRREMLNRNLSMEEVHFAIMNVLGTNVNCIYTDDNDDSDNLLFRIEINKDEIRDKDKKAFTESEKVGNSEYDNINYIQNLEKKIMEKIALRGITNISNAYLREQKNVATFEKDPIESGEYMPEKTDKLVKHSRWVIDTEGSNLLQILALDYIDSTRTISNDIHEVYEILGLECARTVLINEIINVMDMENIFLNQRHVEILVDTMTNKGKLIAIDRHGNEEICGGSISSCIF